MKKNKVWIIIVAIALAIPFLAGVAMVLTLVFVPTAKLKRTFNYAISNASNKIATRVQNQKTNSQKSGRKAAKSDIKAAQISRIGKHIYYVRDELFSGDSGFEERDKAIKEYLESVDKITTEDVFVTQGMYYPSRDEVQISALAYEDGVILNWFRYTASSTNNNGFVQKFSRQVRPALDKSGLIKPKKIIPDVKTLASANTGQMMMDQGNAIYGTYVLKHDQAEDRLYYEFTLNRFSFVKADAKTGEIFAYNFYDGVVY